LPSPSSRAPVPIPRMRSGRERPGLPCLLGRGRPNAASLGGKNIL
jgi:hypothetical protein